MTLTPAQIELFNTHGYVIIDDFLPSVTLHDLNRNIHQADSITPIFQNKPEHYSHVFKSSGLNLPGPSEAYIARFALLGGNALKMAMQRLLTRHLAPIMKQACPEITHALLPNAIRLRSEDVFRAHQDGYAGVCGYSFFVNNGWTWDYGGLLTYVRGEAEAEVIFPKNNRLLLRNEKHKHFHWLNTVEPWVTKNQYIILGWADTKKGETSEIRGEYLEI